MSSNLTKPHYNFKLVGYTNESTTIEMEVLDQERKPMKSKIYER